MPTNPHTPGAQRAAEAIAEYIALDPSPDSFTLAGMIDEATGLHEMTKALQSITGINVRDCNATTAIWMRDVAINALSLSPNEPGPRSGEGC